MVYGNENPDKIIRKGIADVCRINRQKDNNMTYLSFEGLEDTGIVKHVFTTRQGGVSSGHLSTLNLSYSRGDKRENVDENFRRVAELFGLGTDCFVCSDQTHTVNIRKVTKSDKGKRVTKPLDYKCIDGLITNEPGIILSTFYADCVPLYIVDIPNRAIGLAHSGWRGTADKMGREILLAMNREYGTRPGNVKVAIGPSICQDCYEVSDDVALCFADSIGNNEAYAGEYLLRYNTPDSIDKSMIDSCLLIKKDNGKYQLNLWYANYKVFRDMGVADSDIEITDICTCCNPEFLFSHRASRGMRGNMGAFMALR